MKQQCQRNEPINQIQFHFYTFQGKYFLDQLNQDLITGNFIQFGEFIELFSSENGYSIEEEEYQEELDDFEDDYGYYRC